MLVQSLLLITTVFLTLYHILTKHYNYWSQRGIKHVKPHFLFGSYFDLVLFRKTRAQVNQDIYNAGSGEPYIGIIQTRKPALYIRDPEVIRSILTKDFPYFHDRGAPINEKKDPLLAHLVFLEGARWRNLRTKLTPTFTSGKMKIMLPLMKECADEMISVLDEHADCEKVVEMREILARFATDVIGTCAFGVQCNSLRDPNAEFRKKGAVIIKPSKFAAFIGIFLNIFPELAKVIPMRVLRKDVADFFLRAFKEAVKFREANNVQRSDFLDLLMQIKRKGSLAGSSEELEKDAFIKNMANTKQEDIEFTESLMAAQAFVFFVAGFETTSLTLSYALIELAHNPHIQETLQAELDQVFNKDRHCFTFDALMEMPYLNQVVSGGYQINNMQGDGHVYNIEPLETLRMYPPAPHLFRIVTENYKIPNSDLILEKGMRIFIPIHAIHHDPDIYPDPETFNPERFTEDAKRARHHYVYLPFGEGPRTCIGRSFGLLQVKLALSVLLRNFTFELGPEMPYPPVISRLTQFLLLTPDHGTYLRIKKRLTKSS